MSKARLSGWQRIGVVVSILWLVGSFIIFSNMQINAGKELANTVYSLCLMGKYGDANRCDYKAYLNMFTKGLPDWADVAFSSIAPIPVFWLVGWGVIRVLRWIRTGFAN